MYIEDILKSIQLPEKYLRNNKEWFYDTYRAKLIPITPEEVVRQKIARWCEEYIKVPTYMLILENHLSHYGIDSKDRADIIIHETTDDGLLPLVVIECKANTVFLSEKTLQQCFKYSDLLQTDYAIITNGIELLSYKYNFKTKQYDLLSDVPSYSHMLSRKFTLSEDIEPIKRPSYESLFSPETQSRYVEDSIIGSKTTIEYKAYAINFLEALLDGEHTIVKKQASFEIVKDLGVRILTYGNAAGYNYVAPYRSFLIKDRTNNNQIISIGFNAYGNNKTILCVAIDDFKKSHHALQLFFDKYMVLKGNKMNFFHNGQLSVGHIGSAKNSDLVEYIRKTNPSIVKDDIVDLGCVNAEDNIYLNSNDTSEFIIKLMEYALLRDEFRSILKEKKEYSLRKIPRKI